MNQPSRVALVEFGVFCALTAAAVLSRVFAPAPNFAAVAAAALFAGFFFRSRAAAIGVPLSAMLITDLVAGGYSPAVMFAVYGCMALPALLGVLARRDLRGVQGAGALLGPVRYVRALLLALSCGLAFFAVTNLAVFLSAGDGAYPRSLAGLAECYWAALPFYRNGVAADLIYGALVFGGYGVVRGRVLAGRAVSQTINTADNIG